MTTYGPYKRKDGRWIIIVEGVTISYPKYLYECHHNCTIAEGYEVDHKDDDPNNNAIDNLQLLSKIDNIRKQHKSFAPSRLGPQTEKQKRSGVKNGMAKFTEADIKNIRAMLIVPGLTIPNLMKKYGVCRKTITNILEGKAYK